MNHGRIYFAVLVLWAAGGSSQASELKDRAAEKAAEEQEARAEEVEEAAQNTEKIVMNFSGKLTLYSDARTEDSDPIGTFTSEGRTYLLKVDDPKLLDRLKPYNRNEVALIGRPRNKSKYFVAREIVPPVRGSVFRRKRGGA